jgi:hypothetical protein
MNFRQQVEATKAFKKLNSVLRQSVVTQHNLKVLEAGVKQISEMECKPWNDQTQFNQHNRDIVNELYTAVLEGRLKVVARQIHSAKPRPAAMLRFITPGFVSVTAPSY